VLLRVVVADDHYLLREGLRALLGDGGVTVCAAVGSAPELLAAVERERPAAVLTYLQAAPGRASPGRNRTAAAPRPGGPMLGR
jgi:DNA-binding NarL/FixJ family response regulator